MALATWTDQQVINQLNSGSKWSGSVITYSFPTVVSAMATYSGESGFTAFNATQQARAELALTLWDDVIASSIQKVTAGTTSTASNIEFGNATSGVSYAHAYFPTSGSVWMNTAYNSSQGGNDLMTPKIGAHGFLTFVHEIGHALGLEHMGDYNGSADTPSSYQDSTVYSVMSYFGPSWGSGSSNGQGLVAWADWVGADGKLYSPQTPMMNDIMAMQSMYGADTTTRTGDTVYGFQSNITGTTAAIFDFTQNLNPIICIWDAGGNDTLNLSGWNTASTIDLAPGSFSSANSMTMNISIARGAWIENAVTGNGNDTVAGNDLANVITTNGGNDTIAAGSGNDTINGGDGYDTVVFGDSWSNLSWTYDVALATFSFMGVLIGTDTISAVERFVDSLNVERTLASLLDPSLLPAVASVAVASSQVVEGTGTTTGVTFTITLSKAATAQETLTWTAAGTGSNAANASDFSGDRTGAVTFAAGETTKTVTIYLNGDADLESAETFAITLSGASSGLTLGTASALVTISNDDVPSTPLVLNGTSRSEVLTGTDYVDQISGGGGNDTLYGGASGDILIGAAGHDILDGGTGADSMNGGAGNDIYYVDNVGDTLTEARNAGTDTVRTTLSAYALSSWLENLEFLGTGDVTGTGNELANRITGGAGNDTLSGGIGNDTLVGGQGNDILDGGTGNDTMSGGAGNDTYYVDSSRDSVTEQASQGIDIVSTRLASYRLGNNLENLTYTGTAGFKGTGNTLDNVITGSSGADTLDGGAGNDTLYGHGGNDSLVGGTGNDILYGGEGADRLAGGIDVDWLYGGLGNDTLAGGAGADKFVFAETGAGNADRITDFDSLDQILLDVDVFTDIGSLGTLLEQAFGSGSAATTADQRILHDQSNGALYYDADGSGSAEATIFAYVKAGQILTHDDFALVA